MSVTLTADFQPLSEIAAIQERRWTAQRAHVSAHSAIHRRLWGDTIAPERLADIGRLPLLDKAMLRESQAAHPPFGDYLAMPTAAIRRLHRTSGTTGQAMNLALSEADTSLTSAIGARAQRAAGLGPGHRVVHCLNYRMWMGGFTDHTTLEATGAMVVPYGVGGTEQLVRTIREIGIDTISCTPSYPAVIEQVIAQRFPGLKPRDLGLRLGLFGGEAGLDDPNLRQRISETWGLKPRNANYGVSDVLSNFAGQCEDQTDLHFVALDALFPELIDPSGAVVPWRTGSEGELVLTHLAKECQPLVRFRTGDRIVITATGPCVCGRTAPRFRVIGRTDDMVVVRGLNVFPTSVAAILTGFAELSGEYRVRLKGNGPYDRLPVEAELADGGVTAYGLAVAVEARIKRDLGVSAVVTLMPPLSLPRTEGKTRRVLREDG